MSFVRVLVVASVIGVTQGCTSLDVHSEPARVAEQIASSVRAAKPPPGFLDFCTRSPGQCTASVQTPEPPLVLDVKTWDTLQNVNTSITRALTPKDDAHNYGVEEYWTIPIDGYGDCDDYVLAKRSALIAAGIPESALSIAVVFTPRFVRHALLIVATDHGNYVLDNLRSDIVTWDRADYGWIKHQTPASSSGWAFF